MTADTFLTKILPLLFSLAARVVEFVQAEKERTGKTTAQIFEEAGVRLDDNNRRLLDDLARLKEETTG